MEATVHRPGEGEKIGGRTTVTIKATGEDTGGSLYLGETVVEPGFPGPPPHRHCCCRCASNAAIYRFFVSV